MQSHVSCWETQVDLHAATSSTLSLIYDTISHMQATPLRASASSIDWFFSLCLLWVLHLLIVFSSEVLAVLCQYPAPQGRPSLSLHLLLLQMWLCAQVLSWSPTVLNTPYQHHLAVLVTPAKATHTQKWMIAWWVSSPESHHWRMRRQPASR